MTRTLVAEMPQPPLAAFVRRSRLSYVGAACVALGWAALLLTANSDSESSLPDVGQMSFVVANLAGIFLAWLGRRRSTPRTASRRTGTAVLVGVVALTAMALFWPTRTVTVRGGGSAEVPSITTTSMP